MCFLVFHFSLWCSSVFSQLGKMETSVSFVPMGSNLSFLGVVLVLDLDLFFFLFCTVFLPISGGNFQVVSLLSGVCCGPTIEVTSEVRAPELFLSGFACLSWLVATLVFGSLESFSVTASMTVSLSWISALISFTSWETTSGFVVVFVSHMIALFVGYWDIFFVPSTYFVVSTILFASE